MADAPLIVTTALCQRTVIQGGGVEEKTGPTNTFGSVHKGESDRELYWSMESGGGGRERKKKKLYHSSQTFRCGDEPLLILMVRPLGMQIYV